MNLSKVDRLGRRSSSVRGGRRVLIALHAVVARPLTSPSHKAGTAHSGFHRGVFVRGMYFSRGSRFPVELKPIFIFRYFAAGAIVSKPLYETCPVMMPRPVLTPTQSMRLNRYKQLRGIFEDSLGEGELPPDLPSDDKLIAAGAVAAGGRESDAEAQSALKGGLPFQPITLILHTLTADVM